MGITEPRRDRPTQRLQTSETLASLDEHLVSKILGWTTPKDLMAAKCVSRVFRSASQDEDVWEKAVVRSGWQPTVPEGPADGWLKAKAYRAAYLGDISARAAKYVQLTQNITHAQRELDKLSLPAPSLGRGTRFFSPIRPTQRIAQLRQVIASLQAERARLPTPETRPRF